MKRKPTKSWQVLFQKNMTGFYSLQNWLVEKGNRKSINAIRVNESSPLIHKSSKVANIMNAYFATYGQRLAAKIPHSEKHFSSYLPTRNDPDSAVFYIVEPRKISMEILQLSISINKSHGLCSCPVRFLKCLTMLFVFL